VVSCLEPACGACCTGQAALPVSWYAAPEPLGDPATLPAGLRADLFALLAHYRESGDWPPDGSPCVWYDPASRRCRHYEHRPQLCRDEVQPGDAACRRWRRACGVGPRAVFRLRAGRLVRG
jgi:Fe-S-cluster containining protein